MLRLSSLLSVGLLLLRLHGTAGLFVAACRLNQVKLCFSAARTRQYEGSFPRRGFYGSSCGQRGVGRARHARGGNPYMTASWTTLHFFRIETGTSYSYSFMYEVYSSQQARTFQPN